MRKTKIVCTLGPATDNKNTLKRLIKAGMNVARINMSHGNYQEHKMRIDAVKELRTELGMPIAIMLDSKGPEVRVKKFKGGKVELLDGAAFTLVAEDIEGNASRAAITYPALYKCVKVGDHILINDGFIDVIVERIDGTSIVTTVVHGGELSNNKSINLPNTHIDMPYMSEVDKHDFLFGVQEDVDYVALSFVRCKADMQIVRDLLDSAGGSAIRTIAKIENQQGVDNLNEILDIADGAMVARGDMGVEIAFDKLPSIQKKMIFNCYLRGKTVITATQMLESMIVSPRPTRAETSDVANAIYDSTSATMLSGETAVGRFNVKTVETMSQIALSAESNIDYKKRFRVLEPEMQNITDAVSYSAVNASYNLKAKAIVVVTQSGNSARRISRFRPSCPIISVTVSPKAYQQLAMNWGVYPIIAEEKSDWDELYAAAIVKAKQTGIVKSGDLVVFAAGVPVGIAGSTNTLRIENIK